MCLLLLITIFFALQLMINVFIADVYRDNIITIEIVILLVITLQLLKKLKISIICKTIFIVITIVTACTKLTTHLFIRMQ